MPIDYKKEFPLSSAIIPNKLCDLITPIGLDPQQKIEVACWLESDKHASTLERVQMQTAVVSEGSEHPLGLYNEAMNGGVVQYGSCVDEKACAAELTPSIRGLDYIVASWGDGSFFSFNLAEKVWMALGLTPRCIGNEHQKLIFDDLGLPEFGIAEGEVSSEYFWRSQRNICWRMSNEYLRKYLWLRGARAVRVFYYQTVVADHKELRELMKEQKQITIQPNSDYKWYMLDLREHEGALMIQAWAAVEVADCELCPQPHANGLVWPGIEGPMTFERANALIEPNYVYLDDKFLERYEQNAFYDSTPSKCYGEWDCGPSYKGQWSFTDCYRVGRNLIRVPIRELYQPKPDREIIHAHKHSLEPAERDLINQTSEHIAAKTQRLIDELLRLGDNLSALGACIGLEEKTTKDLVGFTRGELEYRGWLAHPPLCRLAHVSPVDMTQQSFLARCKTLHEIWQKIPDGYLKRLLEKAGCPRDELKGLRSMKLLQALANVLQQLNSREEAVDAFISAEEPLGWNSRNETLSMLFLNYDLRVADAHESAGSAISSLQTMGFDIARLNDGYGLALDFVVDGVINAFKVLNLAIEDLLE